MEAKKKKEKEKEKGKNKLNSENDVVYYCVCSQSCEKLLFNVNMHAFVDRKIALFFFSFFFFFFLPHWENDHLMGGATFSIWGI